MFVKEHRLRTTALPAETLIFWPQLVSDNVPGEAKRIKGCQSKEEERETKDEEREGEKMQKMKTFLSENNI